MTEMEKLAEEASWLWVNNERFKNRAYPDCVEEDYQDGFMAGFKKAREMAKTIPIRETGDLIPHAPRINRITDLIDKLGESEVPEDK